MLTIRLHLNHGDGLQATWLLKLAKQDEAAAQKAFASIPDYVIRDLTAWLSFVIRYGQPDLVASCRLDVLVAFLVEMLQRVDLVQSPIIHAKMVELLLTMLSPQLSRRRGRGVLFVCLSLLHDQSPALRLPPSSAAGSACPVPYLSAALPSQAVIYLACFPVGRLGL